ncbi:hypothetical protein MMC30_006721 [Trapelia coarctata]|nr:hypothetical protein [Trapelia coarctata]
MAALHVVGKGTIYHSSIKGAGRGSAHTAGLVLNTCNVNGHRYSGNCGEMGAITDAKAKGWNVRGGYMAVYGITNKDMGTEDYMAPCHDRGGKTGCEGVTGEQGEGINCFTRRDGKSVCKSKNPPQKSPSPKTQQQKTPPQKTSPQKVPSKSKTGKKRSVVFARGTRIALGSHREI